MSNIRQTVLKDICQVCGNIIEGKTYGANYSDITGEYKIKRVCKLCKRESEGK